MGDPRIEAGGHPAPEGELAGGPAARIDGPALLRMLRAGAAALRAQADAINAINVFPVPDGDTGTNMSLTMRAAVDAVSRDDEASGTAVARAVASGALMGAKGNSGVILSQILAGFAAAPVETRAFTSRDIAEGLARGRDAAYRVVSQPKEGTILTAVTAAARAATDSEQRPPGEMLDAVVVATRDAVARTPDLLPVLKEAGVVDSGAQGLAVLLDGMLRGLRGEASAPVEPFGAIDADWLAATQRAHGHAPGSAGFCTEFVISGDLDLDDVRARMLAMGDSVLVVQGGGTTRVHLHTRTPEEAIARGREFGVVSQEKVDDMEAQVRALAQRVVAPAAGGVAVVAVASGKGLEELFASLGACVVPGGQTNNPSAGEIRRAAEAAGSDDVIVLPDNKNIILTANQAIAGLPGRVAVIETRSIPQGIAALVARNPEAPFDENVAAMSAAVATVTSVEITLASRATRVGGIDVRTGQPIGLIDGELAVAEETVAAAVAACVARIVAARDASLVTLYAGDGETQAAADALAAAIRARHGIEVEVVMGGQPHYPYIVGVE